MKLSQLKQIIKEEIQNSLKEAPATPALKPLDFTKLDNIFNVLTTPQPGLSKEESGYETISDEKPGSFKYVTKFLQKLADAHAKGDKKFIDFISKNTDTFPPSVTVEDDITDYLKDKNLAKQIQKLNDIFYGIDYNLYEIEPDDVIRSYNELADFVNKFGTTKDVGSNSRDDAKAWLAAKNAPASPAKTYTGSDMAKLVNSPDFDQKYTITTNAKGEMVITPKK
jgi:hypothetical protein